MGFLFKKSIIVQTKIKANLPNGWTNKICWNRNVNSAVLNPSKKFFLLDTDAGVKFGFLYKLAGLSQDIHRRWFSLEAPISDEGAKWDHEKFFFRHFSNFFLLLDSFGALLFATKWVDTSSWRSVVLCWLKPPAYFVWWWRARPIIDDSALRSMPRRSIVPWSCLQDQAKVRTKTDAVFFWKKNFGAQFFFSLAVDDWLSFLCKYKATYCNGHYERVQNFATEAKSGASKSKDRIGKNWAEKTVRFHAHRVWCSV